MSDGVLPLQLRDPLRRRDLPEMSVAVNAALARRAPALLEVDVRGLTADAVAVDAVARLALAARRHGCMFRLRAPAEELRALLELAGLSELVG